VRTLSPPLTEDQLVAAITHVLSDQPRRLLVGIGDDAAVWKAPRSHVSVISTDALVDGVHFRSESTTPHALGHKALAVNLSDIAAMGAAPVLAVVALGITDVVDERWARELYAGMSALAIRYGCAIAGGDIVRSPVLSISVTAVGDVRKSGLRLRSGAKPGDVACITGPLGLAAAGLIHNSIVRSNGPSGPLSPHESLILAAYETPQPRVHEGRFLAASRSTHALMDISDGLSLDVARMARASGVDVCLDLAHLSPHPALAGMDAMELMLHGGDDYELLAAVDARAFSHLAKRFAARFKRALEPVGRFEKGDGKVWALEGGSRREHVPRGYDHLSGTQANLKK